MGTAALAHNAEVQENRTPALTRLGIDMTLRRGTLAPNPRGAFYAQ